MDLAGPPGIFLGCLGGLHKFFQMMAILVHIGAILGHNGLREGAAGPSLFFPQGVIA